MCGGCRTFCVCVEGGVGHFVFVCGGKGGGHFVFDKVGCVSMHVYLCVDVLALYVRVILVLFFFYTLKQHECKCHYLAASRQRKYFSFQNLFHGGLGRRLL